MASALIKGYLGQFDPEQFKDLCQQRVQKIIDAQLSHIKHRPASESRRSATGVPDVMEQIRLSLARIEASKKPIPRSRMVASAVC